MSKVWGVTLWLAFSDLSSVVSAFGSNQAWKSRKNTWRDLLEGKKADYFQTPKSNANPHSCWRMWRGDRSLLLPVVTAKSSNTSFLHYQLWFGDSLVQRSASTKPANLAGRAWMRGLSWRQTGWPSSTHRTQVQKPPQEAVGIEIWNPSQKTEQTLCEYHSQNWCVARTFDSRNLLWWQTYRKNTNLLLWIATSTSLDEGKTPCV